MGNLAGMLLAWRMFNVPESELSSTASGRFLNNAKEVGGSSDEVANLIGQGVLDFGELEGVSVSSSARSSRGGWA